MFGWYILAIAGTVAALFGLVALMAGSHWGLAPIVAGLTFVGLAAVATQTIEKR